MPLSVYFATEPGSGNSIANTGTVRWHYQTAILALTLRESNGIIYASGSDLTSATGSGIVYALKISDGSVLWHTQVSSPGLAASVVDNGIVYVASLLDGTVYALRANTGSVLWQVKVNNSNAGVSNLQVANGTLYVSGVNDQTIYALKASDGSLLWKDYTSQRVLFSLQVDGDTVYATGATVGDPFTGSSLTAANSTLYALNASNGEERWHFVQSKNGLSTPVFVDGNLYMSTPNGSIYSLRASDGSVAWHTSIGSSGIIGAPVVDGENLYLANADTGTVYALGRRDGKQIWHASSGEIDPYVATVANNTVYIAALASGKIEALRESEGSTRWQADVSGGNIGSQSSSPLVTGGMVYVQDNGSVYALQESNGMQRWHYTTDPPAPGINPPMIVG